MDRILLYVAGAIVLALGSGWGVTRVELAHERQTHQRDNTQCAGALADVTRQRAEQAQKLATALESERQAAADRDALGSKLENERTSWLGERSTLIQRADLALRSAQHADPALIDLATRPVPDAWVVFLRSPLAPTSAPGS